RKRLRELRRRRPFRAMLRGRLLACPNCSVSILPHFGKLTGHSYVRVLNLMGSMDLSQGNPVPPAPRGRARTPWFVVAGIFAAGLIAGLVLSQLNIAGAQTPSPSPSAKGKLHGFGHGLGHKGLGFGGA